MAPSMLALSLLTAAGARSSVTPVAVMRPDLRPDGVPVALMPPGALEREFKTQMGGGQVGEALLDGHML